MPFKSSVSQGYLLALTSKISDLAYEFAAERVLVMGRLGCASFVRSERYSMGGFGAFQLGGFAPDAFDLVMSVAGYGLGTLEPQGRETSQRLSETFKRHLRDFSVTSLLFSAPDAMYGAPQPASGEIFQEFLENVVSQLSRVPIVVGVHAQKDAMSSFMDASASIVFQKR